MTISNIRIERKNGLSFLTVDVKTNFSTAEYLWFSVPSEYEDWLTDDVYDAFMVAAIYPAMYYGEDIEIKGQVSHKLYFNCTRYIQSIVRDYKNEMKLCRIYIDGYKNAEQKYKYVGTGFSAGVDSFSTFYDHYENEDDESYKISTLFFFNVGSHGGGGEFAREVFHKRFDYLMPFAAEKKIPYVPVDSNLFDFYHKKWEFDAGQFCRSSAILVFQKALSKYYISSDYSYGESMFFHFNPETTSLSELVENYANPMLSTEVLEVITDGGQYTRIQKTRNIINYKPANRYLNVCIDYKKNHTSADNCGRCLKCVRTLVALDSLDALDNFKTVFDIEDYKRHSFIYKCDLRVHSKTNAYINENVKFAKSIGRPFPNLVTAEICFFIYRVQRKIKSIIKSKANEKV